MSKNDFWINFIEKGIHPDKPDEGLIEVLEYLQQNPIDSIPDKDKVISILFHRIGSTISECYFGDINVLIISLLSELASKSSMNHLMQPGLYESIFIIFLNNDVTYEKSVEFLDNFFERPDIDSVLEDVIMITIVNLANYSPPKQSLWRFLCKFLLKFGEKIEKMCDFSAVESNGLMPVFTRSLIWDYRNIYQHPPEKEHEEIFWQLWKSVLQRYKIANGQQINTGNEDIQKEPVISLFFGLMNEIRLSLYFSMLSAQKDGKYVSDTPLEVWGLLCEIDINELLTFLESQYESEGLKFALQATLSLVEGEHKKRVLDMLSQY